jgi:nucleotide-binding universal stress UspA family protein
MDRTTTAGARKRRIAVTKNALNIGKRDGDVRRVVVGVDGSTASLDALDWAGRQAQLTDSDLEVIMTWDWPTAYGLEPYFPGDYDPSKGMPELLEKAATDLRGKYPDIEIESRVAQGHPAPVLVEASKGADLLVVGSRGHGEFVGMLIGSVSEFCVTNAHCPVLVHRAV